ncbi:MAG TPA: twin-arginine translocase TatA/TatE family subunit [Candidatus Binatia bacterium]|nr:twin-arginine translocase TatA/TatE family subunit [Candidatus Binatia bacterium]
MLDIGLQEMLLIGIVALLVFGPSKLPELGRMVGRFLREFRRASDEFRSTVETNLHIHDPDPPGTPAETDAAAATAPLPSETEPAWTDPADTPVEVADAGEPFCGARSGRLFHRRTCAWVTRIPEVERVYWKEVADPRDLGLAPCPVCDPG